MLLYQFSVTLVLTVTGWLVWRNHQDFRRPPRRTPEEVGVALPLVSVLVPARNEAANIEACLDGLLAQDYPRFEVLVLDDGSTDGTGERVRALAAGDPRLRLVVGSELPPGWAGKAHACWNVAQEAGGEWLLFVDADTRHAPDLVFRAVVEARRSRAEMLSTFPRQEIASAGEAMTVPMIYWVLFTLLPIRWIESRPSPGLAAACGQFVLVQRDAYFTSGGHSSLPNSLHDGLHLARLFKSQGRRFVLVDLSTSISCRMYRGWQECWSGFSRNAFQAIGSVPVLLFLTLFEAGLCLSPIICLFSKLSQGVLDLSVLFSLLQVGLLAGIQVSLKRRFGYPWLSVVFFPVAVVVFLAIQWRSWWNTEFGCSSAWKGRVIRSVKC